MGGSSKQVTGYRYFANFLLFIGNPIEKVLGINFDKRGWQTPLIDEHKNPLAVGVVDLPNLYGENEGGVKGLIHAKYGTKTQSPVDFYVDYLAKNDFPPIAYPYQSYLTFKDFYLGNSGYMKEMLLWPKRIHVRNDGRGQWYDLKSEIGSIRTYAHSSELYNFNIPMLGKVIYQLEGTPGSTEEPEISIAGFGSGTFPFYDAKQSYQYIPDDSTGVVLPVQPSLQATSHFFNDNYLPIVDGDGCELPPTVFDLYPIEGDRGTQIARNYEFSGNFYWLGGVFSGRALLSGNNASIAIKKQLRDGSYADAALISGPSSELKYAINDFSFNLEKGFYKTVFWSGAHYLLQSTPRPYGGMWVYAQQIAEIQTGDINPIHKIREILTDDTAMNKPEASTNEDNFIKAADRIYDEGLGISWSITEKSCIDAINELCYHIEAGIRVNRQTGLYEMVLFRDDWFEENEIHTIALNKIKSMSLEVANADEAINQLNISYYNRESIKDSSFSVAENASIRNLNGRVNAEDVDFPYFMNQRNAAVVAQWKLKQMSSPVWKGSFTTAEYNARKWNRYDLLKLAWPRKWQGEITVRIMKINLGIGTDVSIDFVEVVPYSSQLWSDVVIDEPIDVDLQPPLACQYEPFEMPYYLAVMALGQRQVDDELNYENNFGLVGVVAEKPQSNSLYAVMMTHDGTEDEEWLRAATINYEPTADLDQNISKTSSSFVVKGGADIASVSIGTLIKCGRDWIGTPGEWMVFMGIDPYTGVVSVKRGALDSLPQEWGINTKLYFCGKDVAYDQTEYVLGEEVFVSALTTTPSGMLENKGSIGIDMKARAVRPYPPANVKINGEYWPTNEISSDMEVSWVDRNRLQQTGGEIIGWFDSGVTIEPGVTYGYDLYDSDSNLLLNSAYGISSPLIVSKSLMSENNRFELYSIKNEYKSYQSFMFNFTKSSTEQWTPELINSSVWIDANSQIVDANGNITSATNISNNLVNLTCSKVQIGLDNTKGFKYYQSLGNGYHSNGIAYEFNGRSRAWMFAIINCASSIEGYIFDIGRRRFEIGVFDSAFPGLIVNTHQLESSGSWSSTSPVVRPRNTWDMLLVEVDLNSGFKIYRNGSLEMSTNKTPSRVVFSNSDGSDFNVFSASLGRIKCASMLSGYSDISPTKEKLFGWAAHEYGLTDLLPVDHPYKTEPPMV